MEESYKTDHEWKIVWKNVVVFLYIHLGALYGVYMLFSQAKWLSFVWRMCHIYMFLSVMLDNVGFIKP